MKNQTVLLQNAYANRDKVEVVLANDLNPLVQAFGKVVLGWYNRTIARVEAKHGKLN